MSEERDGGVGGGGLLLLLLSEIVNDPFPAASSTRHRFGVPDGIVSPGRRRFNLNVFLYFHQHILTDLPSAPPPPTEARCCDSSAQARHLSASGGV